MDAAIVLKELELIASCKGISVLECVSGDGVVVLLGRTVEVGTTTRLVSGGRGIVDVGAAVE